MLETKAVERPALTAHWTAARFNRIIRSRKLA
jgi:hypothetical protein